MRFRWIFLLFLLTAASFTVGCASTNENDISTIPWNRPEQWEGMGALGGFGGPNGFNH